MHAVHKDLLRWAHRQLESRDGTQPSRQMKTQMEKNKKIKTTKEGLRDGTAGRARLASTRP